jgi:hypothetical protein
MSDEGIHQLASEMANDLRPMVQVELMKAWRNGLRDGQGRARQMAEAIRADLLRRTPVSRIAIEALDVLIVTLSRTPGDCLDAGGLADQGAFFVRHM